MVSTLDRLVRGARGRILSIAEDGECCCRLRRMGLREGVEVEVVSDETRDPVMIRFEGCCLALRRCMLRGVITQSSAQPATRN
jgi:Fe2+ transport system protein FeoA